MGQPLDMRRHITLDDELVAELDGHAGARRRSAFIAEIIRRALDDERRCDHHGQSLGSLPDGGHEWDDDPADWVRRETSVRRPPGRVTARLLSVAGVNLA
jgi:Ribbon-helix-helix protein, copG family